MKNKALNILISEMVVSYLTEKKDTHDPKNPKFDSVNYYADTESHLTKPHEHNIKILNKQIKYHKSNFRSNHPNSHKFLHQEAQRHKENTAYHLDDIHKRGPWEVHDFRGEGIAGFGGNLHQYRAHLNDFYRDPDKFENSIREKDHGSNSEVRYTYTRAK